ncbi:MFS transporter [Microbacterium album]|uniref:MFS transporter n=1 Tax=Microbacterium album TaxID=2053191 RepID=A0A917MME2_9MICO|nr:MFS transporter [Microbacterium album]GGH48264.1 MFS transporter [Microbacterium album]
MSPPLRRARLAVVGAFLLNGFLLATWVVNIPVVQERTGVSHSVLGSLLLLLGLGSFLSMQATGWAVDRFGSRAATIAGAVLLIAAIPTPVFAADAFALGAAAFAIGIGNGALDVAMNAHAVEVERRYERPIMSSFHAFFSVGGAIGAGYAAVAHALGWDLWLLLTVAAALALALGAGTLPGLLRGTHIREPATPTEDAAVPAAPDAPAARSPVAARAIALGALAFLLMLAEGVAADWSAVHAREHLGQPEAMAALAYAAFAVAMTTGRFVADRVSARVGPVAVVRYGAFGAAAGLTIVTLSPVLPLTLAGWIVFGLGLSGAVPQIFTAAGALATTGGGVLLSRIVGAGYIGLLAGPAVIGPLADAVTVTLAFLLPAALCVAAGILASVVGPRPHDPPRPTI